MPRRERWEVEMAKRLVSLRDKRGLTQEQLAKRSGVSIWTLRRWEQKGHTPLLRVVWKIADALGVSLDELVGRETPKGKK